MNILITGSGGFIGSNLVNDLKKDHLIFLNYIMGQSIVLKEIKLFVICKIMNI